MFFSSFKRCVFLLSKKIFFAIFMILSRITFIIKKLLYGSLFGLIQEQDKLAPFQLKKSHMEL